MNDNKGMSLFCRPTKQLQNWLEYAKKSTGLNGSEVLELAERKFMEMKITPPIVIEDIKYIPDIAAPIPTSIKLSINDPELDERVNLKLKEMSGDLQRVRSSYKIKVLLFYFIRSLSEPSPLPLSLPVTEMDSDRLRLKAIEAIIKVSDEKKLQKILDFITEED